MPKPKPSKNKSSENAIQKGKILEKLDIAATKGELCSMPKDYLTLENFRHQDSLRMTLLHTAASNRKLDKVPKEFLIPELLLMLESSGQNVLHLAATMGQIEVIPKEILTKDNLLLQDEEGNTVYHYLANYGYIDKIPRQLLSEPIILKKSEYGQTVLDMSIHGEYKEDLNSLNSLNSLTDNPNKQKQGLGWEQDQLLLKLISTKTLKKLLLKNQNDRGKVIDNNKNIVYKEELKRRVIVKNIGMINSKNTFEI